MPRRSVKHSTGGRRRAWSGITLSSTQSECTCAHVGRSNEGGHVDGLVDRCAPLANRVAPRECSGRARVCARRSVYKGCWVYWTISFTRPELRPSISFHLFMNIYFVQSISTNLSGHLFPCVHLFSSIFSSHLSTTSDNRTARTKSRIKILVSSLNWKNNWKIWTIQLHVTVQTVH